jgi:hypothetical protein
VPTKLPEGGVSSSVPKATRQSLDLCQNSHKNRHPERSASQIDRIKQRLWRGVEGPRHCLAYRCSSGIFDHRSPRTRSFRQYALPLLKKAPRCTATEAYKKPNKFYRILQNIPLTSLANEGNSGTCPPVGPRHRHGSPHPPNSSARPSDARSFGRIKEPAPEQTFQL